jgi:hypothetical protein
MWIVSSGRRSARTRADGQARIGICPQRQSCEKQRLSLFLAGVAPLRAQPRDNIGREVAIPSFQCDYNAGVSPKQTSSLEVTRLVARLDNNRRHLRPRLPASLPGWDRPVVCLMVKPRLRDAGCLVALRSRSE